MLATVCGPLQKTANSVNERQHPHVVHNKPFNPIAREDARSGLTAAFGSGDDAVTNPEKQLDLALDRELTGSQEFLRWFLSRTGFAHEEAKVVLTRCDWPWGRVKLRLWNPETQVYDNATREGETDLLVVLQCARRGRFALHIENKLQSGRFTDRQPELYRARAAAWAGKEKYGDYEEWETVLVTPLAFYERNRYEAGKFNRFISHEDIAVHVPEFRAAAEQALAGDAFKATRA